MNVFLSRRDGTDVKKIKNKKIVTREHPLFSSIIIITIIIISGEGGLCVTLRGVVTLCDFVYATGGRRPSETIQR
jgi:hypothetical protein